MDFVLTKEIYVTGIKKRIFIAKAHDCKRFGKIFRSLACKVDWIHLNGDLPFDEIRVIGAFQRCFEIGVI